MRIRRRSVLLIAGLAAAEPALAQTDGQLLDQSRAYASELVADAGGRTSGLAQKDGDFSVNVHGYEQFRYNWNHRDDSNVDGNGNNNTIGFQNARTRLNFSGNIGNENWGYFIQFGFGDPQGGSAFLEDAYGTFKMENGWAFKFGQFKLPLFREELVGDQYQLFADRSVVNSTFTQGRSQGIQLSYEADSWRFFGAFSDGLSTLNTDFTSASEADWALTGRVEWKWAGAWKQFNDFTSFQNSEFAGMLGFAGHIQNGGDTVNTADVLNSDLTLDVSVEGNGWNLFAAGIWSHTDPSRSRTLDDFCFQIQGGLFLNPTWELIAGYDFVRPDNRLGILNSENFSTVRFGVNHYFIPESHAAKLTVDVSWFLNKQDQSIVPVNTQTGLLASDKDSQFNIRGQIQLMF
jgi:hypothetical protein